MQTTFRETSGPEHRNVCVLFKHALITVFLLGAASTAYGADTKLRWDLVSAPVGGSVSPGGFASAFATDPAGNRRLKITMTGSGTFSLFHPTDVTGGGTYTIRDAVQNHILESGTYQVTERISWVLDSPQSGVAVNLITFTSGFDFRNGLGIFRIVYSDGSPGILIVSCAGPGVVNPNIYEGISPSKGTVHFAIPDPPVATPRIDANRTIFTALVAH